VLFCAGNGYDVLATELSTDSRHDAPNDSRGTDAMAHEINWELARLLSLDVSDKVLIPILGGNMRRILAMRRR
jgi:hypothetical protein